MAADTPVSYRGQIMYSVYVRNYSAEGTFESVRRDLPRIRALGTDIVWFMPIHPIGVAGHKGTLGCPYAIRDYRAVNPEYGTLEDFQRLVDDIHALGMKCVIDVVYNHTSPDSWLAEHHPEWFYRTPEGKMGNHLGAWSDVVDLDYTHPELWDYQIDTLKYWAGIVDGFRCDVAPLLPLEFWLRARREVAQVRPGCLWLAESGEPIFIQVGRHMGLAPLSDSELYQAFDLCYDYDLFPTFKDYLEGKVPLSAYIDGLTRQEVTYPLNYVKLRYLENHDNLRAAFLLPGQTAWENWTAFLYFQKGMTLLYMGQEAACAHLPSLFDKEPVDWSRGEELAPLFARLAQLKGHPLMTDSTFQAQALPGDLVLASHRKGTRQLLGVFSLKGNAAPVVVPAPDGCYVNLITGNEVEVKMGKISCSGAPLVFEAPHFAPPPFQV